MEFQKSATKILHLQLTGWLNEGKRERGLHDGGAKKDYKKKKCHHNKLAGERMPKDVSGMRGAGDFHMFGIVDQKQKVKANTAGGKLGLGRLK